MSNQEIIETFNRISDLQQHFVESARSALKRFESQLPILMRFKTLDSEAEERSMLWAISMNLSGICDFMALTASKHSAELKRIEEAMNTNNGDSDGAEDENLNEDDQQEEQKRKEDVQEIEDHNNDNENEGEDEHDVEEKSGGEYEDEGDEGDDYDEDDDESESVDDDAELKVNQSHRQDVALQEKIDAYLKQKHDIDIESQTISSARAEVNYLVEHIQRRDIYRLQRGQQCLNAEQKVNLYKQLLKNVETYSKLWRALQTDALLEQFVDGVWSPNNNSAVSSFWSSTKQKMFDKLKQATRREVVVPQFQLVGWEGANIRFTGQPPDFKHFGKWVKRSVQGCIYSNVVAVIDPAYGMFEQNTFHDIGFSKNLYQITEIENLSHSFVLSTKHVPQVFPHLDAHRSTNLKNCTNGLADPYIEYLYLVHAYSGERKKSRNPEERARVITNTLISVFKNLAVFPDQLANATIVLPLLEFHSTMDLPQTPSEWQFYIKRALYPIYNAAKKLSRQATILVIVPEDIQTQCYQTLHQLHSHSVNAEV